MDVRFGVFVPQGWKMDLEEIEDPHEQFEAMTDVARAADAGPWDSIWVYDHFHTVPEPVLETTFECWTISATLARDTKRVNIGQMVSCNGYRNPALFAKVASTVDVASNGRLYAGIGAGWYEHEWRAYGYGFPEVPQRMAMFREAVEIIHRMWSEEKPVFAGKHYTIDGPINEPKGVRKPHPPLWIGGGGEKVTLKLVAKWGDACNIGGDVETIRHKLTVLRGHCEDVGQNYDELIKSTTFDVHLVSAGEDPEKATEKARRGVPFNEYATRTIVGGPEEVRRRVEEVLDAGINYVLFYIPRVAYDHTMMEELAADVVSRYTNIGGGK